MSSVDVNTPPMTTVASGRCTSEPAPVLSAIGTKPRAATSAVMRTGLSRVAAASLMASARGWPPARSWLMAVTRTTPLRTATPNRAMKPTDAERFSVRPRIHNAAMPPTSANGTFMMTSAACRTLWNVA